ncbi:hypothetical protein B0H13DRAFT_1880457 [Mycena leptocephala]|nr:hypothetical protein B0H13DRAFT_1880457 [Mycena leptocephala]
MWPAGRTSAVPPRASRVRRFGSMGHHFDLQPLEAVHAETDAAQWMDRSEDAKKCLQEMVMELDASESRWCSLLNELHYSNQPRRLEIIIWDNREYARSRSFTKTEYCNAIFWVLLVDFPIFIHNYIAGSLVELVYKDVEERVELKNFTAVFLESAIFPILPGVLPDRFIITRLPPRCAIAATTSGKTHVVATIPGRRVLEHLNCEYTGEHRNSERRRLMTVGTVNAREPGVRTPGQIIVVYSLKEGPNGKL